MKNNEPYIFGGVYPSEYRELKADLDTMRREVINELIESWKPWAEKVKVKIKYHPKRSLVGIFLEIKGKEELARKGNFRDRAYEDTVVEGLYEKIEKRLGSIRTIDELIGEWVDDITEEGER